MQIALLSQAFALGLTLGLTPPQAIIGGTEVAPTHPIASSTVILLQKNEKLDQVVYFCSGSLIAPDLVVTAAHCTQPESKGKGPALPPERFLIYPENLASYKDFDPRKALHLSGAVSHPRYSARFDFSADLHDIALLKLSEPAPASLRPAEILPAARSILAGEKVIVAGYGYAKEQPEATEFVLRQYGEYTFRRFERDLAKLKGPRKLGSYRGDSGGPAYIEENGALRIWGVYSGSNQPTGQAFYIDLRREKDWLQQAATELGTSLAIP